jgi:uracil-DNA glycosylase family 4
VWGEGNPNSPYWLIGEAPGREEDSQRRPFCGATGVELEENYLRRNQLSRCLFYITNLVKCRPPRNRDPKPEEIRICSQHLIREMQTAKPQAVIGTLGRFSTNFIMGRELDMAMYHGIPLHRKGGGLVVPLYHPAVGMHSTTMMTHVANDFKGLAATIRGFLRPKEDPLPDPIYEEMIKVPMSFATPEAMVVGVDTESVRDRVWSVQLSFKAGEAWFIRATNAPVIEWFSELVASPNVLVVLHHAQHDLPMLAQVGIHPKRWTDTMLMANLLQDKPKGLKSLAYRLCGMPMTSYKELVDPITQGRAKEYLEKVAQFKWPKPPKIEVFDDKKKQWRWKQPWSMHTVANSALNRGSEGAGIDYYKTWHGNNNRLQVEAVLGKLEAATIADVSFEKALHYACRDADATYRIYPHLWREICELDLEGPLERDCGIVPMIVDMEQTGIAVDIDYYKKLVQTYTERRDAEAKEIEALLGRPFDPASRDQVERLLFKEMKLKTKFKTKGGKDSTSSEVLETFEDEHPVVGHILKYREYDKMRAAFAEGVLRNALRHSDKRCHTHISTIRVVTGRLASKEPNLLAFPQPARSEEGKPLRDGFVAGEGKVFLSGDYSQIELRVLAHESQEPTMIHIFHDGGDIHRATAAEVFEVDYAEVTDQQRYPIKTVNFGIPYGITASGLSRQLLKMGLEGWNVEACDKLIEKWFKNFQHVAGYMSRIQSDARRYERVRDLYGRQRLIPEVRSAWEWVRSAGLRQAGNAPIQMGAGSIMKEAMRLLVPIYQDFNSQGTYIKPLLQIHDDLLWEVDELALPILMPIIKTVMENCTQLSVPLVVDFSVGKRWGSMEKIK